MQPISHDGYKREVAPQQWVEQTKARPDVYEEQEDQWAVLRHEVEREEMQRQKELARLDWEQRDTVEPPSSPQSDFDALVQAQHQVDIVVVGIGGGGMNAVNRMIHARVRGVRYIAMNTDAQVLALSQANARICLGEHYTKGLGAGGNAAAGMRAATESAEEIKAALSGADMVFIAAGMGGGTGTGATPVVASIARKLGALTVGIVTLPFTFEGTHRRRVAEQGLTELKKEIDALITVPNDRLLTTIAREQSLSDAFKVADDVLRQGVQGIAEVITVPGMVNVDFADVRGVLREAGTALMSIGQGTGRNRAQRAAEEAVAGGFLNVTIRGAKRVLFNISGGEDMTLFEVNEVAERIGEAIDDAADITFGAVIDPSLSDTIRVTLIAAGMEELHTLRLQAMRVEQTTQARLARPSQNGLPSSTPATPMTPRPGLGRIAGQSEPPLAPPPTRMPPTRQPIPPQQPARQQRSLSDLRGIQSMGRRHDAGKRYPSGDEPVDVPPFLKHPD
jgi:cell division protein FtsZ